MFEPFNGFLNVGTGAVKFPTEPEAATKEILPSATLKPRDNYVVCIVGRALST
jgi:hypothetical protein